MTISEKENISFEELYSQYELQVYRLGLKYSDYNHDLAEDALQQTFMKLFIEMQKGVEITNHLSFLHTIVKNYTINSNIKNKREVLIDKSDSGEIWETQEKELSAEDKCIKAMSEYASSQVLEAVLEEMKEYNSMWYLIITEVFYKERSQSEVAKELGMSNTAMYATIKRIRNWSNKHRLRIEEDVQNKLKEVPSRHLFWSERRDGTPDC